MNAIRATRPPSAPANFWPTRKRAGRDMRCCAIGGSATNDAGIGAAAALGWRFLDADGKNVTPDGGHMKDIVRSCRAPAPFEKIEVLCDVTNPLFGPKGAAWIYGRQKGGSDPVLAELDDGLKHVAGAGEGRSSAATLPTCPAQAPPADWVTAPSLSWVRSCGVASRSCWISTGFDRSRAPRPI